MGGRVGEDSGLSGAALVVQDMQLLVVSCN